MPSAERPKSGSGAIARQAHGDAGADRGRQIEKEEQAAPSVLRATGAITIGPGGIVSAPDTAEPEVSPGRNLLRRAGAPATPLESFTEEEQQRHQEMAGGKRKEGPGLD